MTAPPGEAPIPFDTELYDYGDNYNPATGIYTVPYNGSYLIHARLYGKNNYASHYILVDGDDAVFTDGYDAVQTYPSASTSIVLHLVAGQEVAVDPSFPGDIDGNLDYLGSTFGISLLYRD